VTFIRRCVLHSLVIYFVIQRSELLVLAELSGFLTGNVTQSVPFIFVSCFTTRSAGKLYSVESRRIDEVDRIWKQSVVT
jgi:hypothetical protein